MFENIDIEKVKKELRNHSTNYKENFAKIEKFIETEIQEILNLKKNNKSIIPENSINEIDQKKTKVIEDIKKRGCVIIRDVFDDKFIENLNFQLEKYIDENNYYDDQRKKADLDKYFSDLKSGKPQIYGLYWSKAQIEIRHSEQMAKVKKWLNNLWLFENSEYKVFDPNKELSYADRVRRREPGTILWDFLLIAMLDLLKDGPIVIIKKFIEIYFLTTLNNIIHLKQSIEIGQ